MPPTCCASLSIKADSIAYIRLAKHSDVVGLGQIECVMKDGLIPLTFATYEERLWLGIDERQKMIVLL